MNLLKPDLKSVVWLLAGYFVLGKVINVVQSKMG